MNDRVFNFSDLKELSDTDLGMLLGEISTLTKLSNFILLADKLLSASKEVRDEVTSRKRQQDSWNK